MDSISRRGVPHVRSLAALGMLAVALAAPLAQRAVLPPAGPDPIPPASPPSAVPRAAAYSGSIIDAHLHAMTSGQLTRLGRNADWKWVAPPDPGVHRVAVMKALERYRVVLGVLSGVPESLTPWLAANGTRFLAGPMVFEPVSAPPPSIDLLRREYTSGRWGVLGEINAQYAGVAPDDPRLEPYWALAETVDVPVGLHTGAAAPGVATAGLPNFTLRLGNPLLLKEVLAKHRRLRVWLMNGGEPWRRETFALMAQYPQVYLDVGGIDWAGGPGGSASFYEFLNDAIGHGLEQRIMFGSDEMAWPQAIGEAISRVDSAPFLNARQKRAIFIDNAKRFFRIADAPG